METDIIDLYKFYLCSGCHFQIKRKREKFSSENCTLDLLDRVRHEFLCSGACDTVSVIVLLIKCRIMVLVMLEIIVHCAFTLFPAVSQLTFPLLCARGNNFFQELTEVSA